MNRSIAFVLLGLSLMVNPLMANVAIGSQVGMKIGSVDTHRILSDSIEGMRARAEIDRMNNDYSIQQGRDYNELSNLKAQINFSKKTQAEITVLQRNIMEQEKIIRHKEQEHSKKMHEKSKTAMKDILAKYNPIIVNIAKAAGISLVINKEAMLWSEDSVDLTDKVLGKR